MPSRTLVMSYMRRFWTPSSLVASLMSRMKFYLLFISCIKRLVNSERVFSRRDLSSSSPSTSYDDSLYDSDDSCMRLPPPRLQGLSYISSFSSADSVTSRKWALARRLCIKYYINSSIPLYSNQNKTIVGDPRL